MPLSLVNGWSRTHVVLAIVALGLLGSSGLSSMPGSSRGHAEEQPGEAAVTGAADRTDLALTVYNSNVALVRDVRRLVLGGGETMLRFADIAASINPTSVHFRSLTQPGRLRVLEQNYEYDLLEPQKLLQKYVGREVTLVRRRQDAGTSRLEEVQAELLALNNGPVWRIDGEIVTGLSADHIRFPELPDNLYSHPTMVWSLANEGSRRHRVEASYLAGDLNWRSDYVLTVARDQTLADLDGWVTLTNSSGTAFPDARLQLVAGELNRVAERGAVGLAAPMARQMAEAADEAAFVEEAFSEYHLYSLGRRTSIKDRETKQIRLLGGAGVPIEKYYVVEGRQFYYRNPAHPGAPLRDRVKTYLTLKNDAASGLGMPMPAGVVRVYQADRQGNVQFAGEDRIGHTPKDEIVSLHIGNAFDVVAERRQMDFERIASNVHEIEVEVTLRNHKEEPIRVELREPIGGDWEMRSSTHRWTKTAAWAAELDVPIAAGGTETVRYRVRVRW